MRRNGLTHLLGLGAKADPKVAAALAAVFQREMAKGAQGNHTLMEAIGQYLSAAQLMGNKAP